MARKTPTRSPKAPEHVWSVADAARILRVTPPTIRSLIHRRRLRAIHLGRIYRITDSALRQFMALGAQG